MPKPYEEMTTAEKRLYTINRKYGSMKKMLAKRDVSNLILGGYNGGIKKGRKGTATWDEKKIKDLAARRKRDSCGRFVSDERDDAN
jgi:hypothetical protein